MQTLHLGWIFPYRTLGRAAPAPLVPARISIRRYSADILLLVDTGAESTLLDGIHVRAAGGDLFTGPARGFHGFLGASTVAHRHRVRLQIGAIELEREVHFSTHPLERQVLGRDILDAFVLGLREMCQELYMDSEEGTPRAVPLRHRTARAG